MAATDPRIGYAPVNGLDMDDEVHGSGTPPLVLLHGALSTTSVDFGAAARHHHHRRARRRRQREWFASWCLPDAPMAVHVHDSDATFGRAVIQGLQVWDVRHAFPPGRYHIVP